MSNTTRRGITRRGFVAGCSAGLAALTTSRLSLAGVAGTDPADHEVLVVIFLRGGADGLSIVAPMDGGDRGHYEAARPRLCRWTGASVSIRRRVCFTRCTRTAAWR